MKNIILIFTALVIVSVSCTRNRTNPYDPAAAYQSSTNGIISQSAQSLIAVSDTAISFEWTRDDSANFAEYRVYRKSGAAWTLIKTLNNASERRMDDTGLTAGTVYAYKVVSVDKKGTMNESSPIKYMTIPLLAAANQLDDNTAKSGNGMIRKIVNYNDTAWPVNFVLYRGEEPLRTWMTPSLLGTMIPYNAGPINAQNLIMQIEDAAWETVKVRRDCSILFREYDPTNISSNMMMGEAPFYYGHRGMLYNVNFFRDAIMVKTGPNDELLMVFTYSKKEASPNPADCFRAAYIPVDMYGMSTYGLQEICINEYENTNNYRLMSNYLRTNIGVGMTNEDEGLGTGTFYHVAYFAQQSNNIFRTNDTVYFLSVDSSSYGGLVGIGRTRFTASGISNLSTDPGNTVLIKNVAQGKFSEWFTSYPSSDKVGGFAVSEQYLYIANNAQNYVAQYTTSGDLVRTIGKSGTGFGEFSGVSALLVYRGLLFVADTYNSRIQVFNESGEFITSFGSYGVGGYGFEQPASFGIANRKGFFNEPFLFVTDKHRIKYFRISTLNLSDL